MRLLSPVNPIKPSLIFSSLRSRIPLAPSGFLRSLGRGTCTPASRSAAKQMAAAAPAAAMSVAASSEEGLARRLWIKFSREATFARYTPFAVCLVSGSLEIEAFRHYISQDVHFLKAFVQAYELAEECADDDDDKQAVLELRQSVDEELKMHNSFVQEWGLDNEKEAPVTSASLKYTEFLLATATGKVEGVKALGTLATPFEKTKVAAYTLGALTPCMRLYAFLGKEFKSFLDPNDPLHPYKKWIENYADEGFQASALKTEDLLDKLSVSMTGEELDIIEKLYHQAMKLEIEFFNAQPLAQRTVVPLTKEHNPAEDRLMIFSDFDLTCSVVDSSAILAEIAILTAPKSEPNQPEQPRSRMLSADLRNTWNLLSKQYTELYEECIEKIMQTEKAKDFNYEGLRRALEELSDFEKRANLRVIESGVLKGLNLEDIKRAGERLILQDGCANFFQKLVKNDNLNANVHVLSYCWCGDLIRAVFSSGGLDALNVHSNEFKFEESICSGEIVRKVESPIDKAEAFNTILQNSGGGQRTFSVYIGDSVGDLLCLLQADIGIVVGCSSSLRKLGNHFGVSFVPLFTGTVEKQKACTEGNFPNWKGLSGTLYTVSSWAEIHAFVLGW